MKITVLLSTYNGEKYIEQQLESVLSQRNVEIEILVRDDDSSDSTQDILKRYQKAGKLTWYTGENCGPTFSFFDLMLKAPDSDYYAFCDQDDVWLPEKLEVALGKLCECNINQPALYYGCPRFVDEQLQHLDAPVGTLDFANTVERAMICINATGCTMVFNKALLDKVRLATPDYLYMHDACVHRVCLLFQGTLFFDEAVPVMYRQHDNNVIGVNHTLAKRIQSHWKYFISKDCGRSRLTISLYNCYKDNMNEEERKLSEMVVHYKDNLIDKMKLLLHSQMRSGSWKRDVLFRIAVILNAY